MVDNNLPGEPGPDVTTPQSYEDQIEDISNLLGDPATDLPEDDQDEAADKAEKPVDDDPLGLDADAEDVEPDDDSEDPDGPDDAEVKGGRFAPDNAKVKLDNGETITIADLKVRVDKRVKEFQRGFTEKTQALSAKESEVDQRAQQLTEFQEYAAWYAEQTLPKQPGPWTGNALTDPQGYLDWSQQRDRYLEHVQAWQQFQGQKTVMDQQRHGETQKQAEARLALERDALVKALPVLKDPVKGKQAWEALVNGAQDHFGISAEEVNTVGDHRMLLVLRDALAYRRIKAKAPQVQAQVAQKPAVKSGRRVPTNTAESKGRQVRAERLRNSGSFDDAVAALQDFDL